MGNPEPNAMGWMDGKVILIDQPSLYQASHETCTPKGYDPFPRPGFEFFDFFGKIAIENTCIAPGTLCC